MNPENSRPASSKLDRVADLAFGTDKDIQKLSASEVAASLREAGINTDAAWMELQAMLRVAQGKVRMAEAKAKRKQGSLGEQVAAAVNETREALIEQIRGLLAICAPGTVGVYARKWEESSVENLRSIRDELARTAARNAAKKKTEP